MAVSGRPVVSATFAANYALGGVDVRGYHALNIVIHVLAACVLFGVIRLTLQRAVLPAAIRDRARELAFASALLWGVHPLNSEVINYVSQRTESLMGLFLLLTLYTAIRAIDGSRAIRTIDGSRAIRAIDGSRAIRALEGPHVRFWHALSIASCARWGWPARRRWSSRRSSS